MEYADDILARIQAALIDYHAATHTNGRKRTWSAIARELHETVLDTLDTDEDLEDDDERLTDPYKPLAEALRRFAAGTQTPSKERLDALCAYLKSKSFLTDADLRPAEAWNPLVHALSAFFGGPDDGRDFAPLQGRFAASRKLPSGRTELSVVTVRDGGVHAPVVEDKLYSLPIAPQSTKRDAPAKYLLKCSRIDQRFPWAAILPIKLSKSRTASRGSGPGGSNLQLASSFIGVALRFQTAAMSRCPPHMFG